MCWKPTSGGKFSLGVADARGTLNRRPGLDPGSTRRAADSGTVLRAARNDEVGNPTMGVSTAAAPLRWDRLNQPPAKIVAEARAAGLGPGDGPTDGNEIFLVRVREHRIEGVIQLK